MKRQILVIVMTIGATAIFAQAKKPAIAAKAPAKSVVTAAVNPLKTSIDSVSYSIGVRMAQSLRSQGFEAVNLQVLEKAMSDVLTNKKPIVADEAINACIADYQQKASSLKSAGTKKEGAAFLAVNGKRPGVITLPDGIQYEIIKNGTGTARPTIANTIKFHYHGTLINGTVFDSSVDRGEPITYALNRLIVGWQEVLQMMTVGSKWKLYIPSQFAYGDAPSPTIPAGSTLIFEVELLDIVS